MRARKLRDRTTPGPTRTDPAPKRPPDDADHDGYVLKWRPWPTAPLMSLTWGVCGW